MAEPSNRSFDKISDVDVHKELIKCWKSLRNKPQVIVFDLDYTLWPYFVDCQEPPFKLTKKNGTSMYIDQNDFELSHFRDVSVIIKTLRTECFKNGERLAIASRSTTPDLAMQLVEFFEWKPHFDSFQIYSTPKSVHMNAIKQELKLNSFKEFLFFDDETYNTKTTEPMGIKSCLLNTSTGLTLDELINGLKRFDK